MGKQTSTEPRPIQTADFSELIIEFRISEAIGYTTTGTRPSTCATMHIKESLDLQG